MDLDQTCQHMPWLNKLLFLLIIINIPLAYLLTIRKHLIPSTIIYWLRKYTFYGIHGVAGGVGGAILQSCITDWPCVVGSPTFADIL